MQALKFVETKELPHEDWLKLRRKGIGGSDAAAIAGVSRWRSPVTVFLEKTEQIQNKEENDAMYWGIVLEDIVAKEFSKRSGLTIKRKNQILQHPKYDFMLANIDRLIVDKVNGNGVLECKTTSEYGKKEWEDGKIPDEYMLQVQHYLAVTGLSYGYIAVLIGGNKYHHQKIERDEELIEYLIEIETNFWDMVKNNILPPLDGSKSSIDSLNKLYPNADTDSVTILPVYETERLISEYYHAKENEEKSKLLKEKAKNEIKNLMGKSEFGFLEAETVPIITWKNVTTNRIDTKALKLDMPEIYSKYLKPSNSRRLNIKNDGE